MKLFRKALFWLHLGAGVAAGLVIILLASTGTILAFQRQIISWSDASAVHDGRPNAGASLSLDAALKQLVQQDQNTPTELVLRRSSYSPLEAKYGRERTVLLNPWTGVPIVSSSTSLREFFAWVVRLHRSLGLGLQSQMGRGIIGAANLTFLFLFLSGIYLWIPKTINSSAFKSRLLLVRGLKGNARDWNWHHVFGIWAILPLAFIVATGVLISYPWATNLLYRVTNSPIPSVGGNGDGKPAQSNAGGNSLDKHAAHAALDTHGFDLWAEAAKRQIPEWKSITFSIPQTRDKTVTVAVDTSIGGQPEKITSLVIDRSSNAIVATKRFSDNSLGRRLRTWAVYVHTGAEFGLIGQILIAFGALSAIFMVWTGYALTARRLFGNRKRAENRQEEVEAVFA
jgi:uncharacterized iron-regulated membrane protein